MGRCTNAILAGATSEMTGQTLSSFWKQGQRGDTTWYTKSSWSSRKRRHSEEELCLGLHNQLHKVSGSWGSSFPGSGPLCDLGQVAESLWAELSHLSPCLEEAQSVWGSGGNQHLEWAFGVRGPSDLWGSVFWKQCTEVVKRPWEQTAWAPNGFRPMPSGWPWADRLSEFQFPCQQNGDTSNSSLTGLLRAWDEVSQGGHRSVVRSQWVLSLGQSSQVILQCSLIRNHETGRSTVSLHSELHKVTFHHLHMTSDPPEMHPKCIK